MTATARHPAALADRLLVAQPLLSQESSPSTDAATLAWLQAEEIRRDWQACGLATEPADRPAAEASLARLYARQGRTRPQFLWVDSPYAALAHLTGFPTHEQLRRWIGDRRPAGSPPLASDLAAGLSRLRSALEAAVEPPGFDRPPPKRKKDERWRVLPAPDLLRIGVPFREVVRQGVREALRVSLASNLSLVVRAALAAREPVPVAWYGQQEAYWIAYYDTYRRLGLASYPGADSDQLDDWAALARATGWWWPHDELCVVVERPAVVQVEPVPGGWHEQVRLVRGEPAALRYRDGWCPGVA